MVGLHIMAAADPHDLAVIALTPAASRVVAATHRFLNAAQCEFLSSYHPGQPFLILGFPWALSRTDRENKHLSVQPFARISSGSPSSIAFCRTHAHSWRRTLIAVTNTTVVNTETMCELLRKVAALGLTGPITLVLDNARYQRNAVVQALASQMGITLLYLPSYSPNLNLIERLGKFIKRRALYGRYHPTFAEFQAAIGQVLDGLSTTHAGKLKSLMTLNCQRFEDVSLMAA